jgi:hypothetical protein
LNNLNNSSANIKKEDALSIPSVQTPNLGPSLLFARDSQDAYCFFFYVKQEELAPTGNLLKVR